MPDWLWLGGWGLSAVEVAAPAPAKASGIAAELNGRPRQILGFQTPSRVFAEALR